MKRSFLFFSTAVLLAALAAPALAQVRVPCAERAKVVGTLHKDFNETQRGSGLTPAGQLLELFASDKGTWTLLLSLPTGKSCMIATGGAWTTNHTDASRVSGRGA